VAQVALSLVSLVGAGLFLLSLRNAFAIDPGFERENLLVLSFNAGAQGYGPEDGGLLYDRLLEEARALPGVAGASLAASAPLSGSTAYRVHLEGKEEHTGYLHMTGLIGNEAHGEELPAAFLHPAEWNGKAVIWLSPDGKAGLYDEGGTPRDKVMQLHEENFFNAIYTHLNSLSNFSRLFKTMQAHEPPPVDLLGFQFGG